MPGGRVLAVTGGHSVDMAAFSGMMSAICDERDWVWAHATQPSAQRWLRPEHVGEWDAILLHDMPGWRLARGSEPTTVGPDDETRTALRALLAAGQGLVVTHHALGSWPAWDEWAHHIGGRFLYAPGRLDDVEWPSSGYRMGRHLVQVLAPDHPVCDGVGDFEVDDELYLCPVLEGEVTPLLATTGDISGAVMISAFEAVAHRVEDRFSDGHPAGSRLVGWAKVAGRSPLVYLQPGHGPETMIQPEYRHLLGNALAWVASPEAHAAAILGT